MLFVKQNVFTKREIYLCYFSLGIVYFLGLFIPLMENDSAQHAVMSMQMLLDNNFLELYRGDSPYLDKPHLHFWLAASSMKLFGINHIAYRIPALFFTLIGSYSTFKLAKYWYNTNYAHIATLVFLSTQSIILANHDVRTDAVLTGATIFSLWQFVKYVDMQRISALIFGCLGLAIAFMSKGLLGVFFVGVCLIIYIFLSKEKWRIILNPKTYLILPVFFTFITPVLYAYNHQFGIDGVFFILWGQSFNRMTGEAYTQFNTDYSFFFHTILWTFIPWCLLFYSHVFVRLKTLFTKQNTSKKQYITSVAILTILLVISFSKAKLPHYLNSLFSIMAIGVSAYLYFLSHSTKKTTHIIKLWNIVFTILLLLCVVLISFIVLWSYEIPSIGFIILYLIFGAIMIKQFILDTFNIKRLILLGVSVICFLNILLNSHFYPNLLKYQAGISVSRIIESEDINPKNIIRYKDSYSWSLDFYTNQKTQAVSSDEINKMENDNKWLFVYEKDLNNIPNGSKYIKQEGLFEIYHFRITRLSLKFINPQTRMSVLQKAYLIPL